MDDIAIIKMLHHTPQEGLHQLIGAYRGLVGKICANILAGHQEDIEEAIADTFISIWKNVPKLDPQRGSLKGLLIITARHQEKLDAVVESIRQPDKQASADASGARADL